MSIITTDYGLTKPPPGCSIDYGHPIMRGLVGYWMFNEKSGTRLTDYSGYGNHGTLTNFALSGATSNWVGSPTGGALSFDGTDDYVISTPTKSILKFTNRFSILIKIRLITTGAVSKYVYDNRRPSPASSNCAIIYGFVSNKFEFYADAAGYSGTAPRTALNTSVSDNKWHDVAFTYDGAVMRGYLDGKLDIESSKTFTLTQIGTEILFSASDNAGVYTAGVNADFSHIMAYNRPLSGSEISQLYTQPNIGLLTPTYYTPS